VSCSPQWSPLHTKFTNKTQLRPELVTLPQPRDIRHHIVATKTAKRAVTAIATKEGNCAGDRFRSADAAATSICTVSHSEGRLRIRNGGSNG